MLFGRQPSQIFFGSVHLNTVVRLANIDAAFAAVDRRMLLKNSLVASCLILAELNSQGADLIRRLRKLAARLLGAIFSVSRDPFVSKMRNAV